MKATDLIDRLNARIAEVEGFDFAISNDIDADGDGRVTISVSYDEANEFTDEPWIAFGDLPVAADDSGMDNDRRGNVTQYVTWNIYGGEVA